MEETQSIINSLINEIEELKMIIIQLENDIKKLKEWRNVI